MSRCGSVVCCWVVLAVAAAGGGRAVAGEEGKDDANQCYEEFVRAYLDSNWSELKALERKIVRLGVHLTARQRSDVAYVRKTAPTYRPSWWKACKGTRKAKFRATVWRRPILVNYAPANKPNMQPSVNERRQIEVTVSWNPSRVDSTGKVGKDPGKAHGLTHGDEAEVHIWQLLGHSYMPVTLPARTVATLYNDHRHVFDHVQYFYATATGVYHSSPRARRAAMLIAMNGLKGYGGDEAYLRSCCAISSLFVATVLADPAKWPSVPLPDKPPAGGAERKTAMHMLEKLSPEWTLAEDRALREAVRALRSRGRVQLPNKTVFMLMKPDDAAAQAQRNAWVRKQLEKTRK